MSAMSGLATNTEAAGPAKRTSEPLSTSTARRCSTAAAAGTAVAARPGSATKQRARASAVWRKTEIMALPRENRFAGFAAAQHLYLADDGVLVRRLGQHGADVAVPGEGAR